jgi:MerR HTH family regulatory protein
LYPTPLCSIDLQHLIAYHQYIRIATQILYRKTKTVWIDNMEVIVEKHYVLAEVGKILGRRPHQIIYLLTSGKIPEPAQRIGNRRLFSTEDIDRFARHFRVSPKWTALDETGDGSGKPSLSELVLRPPFEVFQVGETGHEVRDGDGQVFAWTGDRGKALVLAGLLDAAAGG